MKETIAIIDLGTNTFHLLIAQHSGKRLEIVHKESATVRIARGTINQGVIGEDGLRRAITALKAFRKKAMQNTTTQIYAFATSALRSASNGREVVARIKNETGITINVLPGEREAEFIFYGVRRALDFKEGTSLIVDIGGGSVEFILAARQEIVWKRSYEIGGQRLLERFQQHDPIHPAEVSALEHYLTAELTGLSEAIKAFQPDTLIGSSGTFDTLSEIYCRHEGIPFRNDPETPLTPEAFYRIHDDFLKKNRDERMAIPGMIEMRVDMIVVASCIVNWILTRHAIPNIRVSSYSMKEGVLDRLEQGALQGDYNP